MSSTEEGGAAALMRSCGSCTLCCKLVPVEEIGKAAGTRCKYVRSGKGCSIYARRPISCREWSCLWIKGTENGHQLDLPRPDRAHYVVDEMPDIIKMTNNVTGEVQQIPVMQIWCDPKFPKAWKDPPLLDMLERQGIVGLIRYDSIRALTVWPPKTNSTGQWQYTPTQNSEDLRVEQRAARLEFFEKQMRKQA